MRVALDGGEVLRAQRLVAVLAAAHVEEVVRVGVDLLARIGAAELERDPAPFAAPLQEQQVAAVGVDVHQVRVQRADPQHRAITTLDADVLVRGGDALAGDGGEARRAGLGGEAGGGDDGELDDVGLRRAVADEAQPLDARPGRRRRAPPWAARRSGRRPTRRRRAPGRMSGSSKGTSSSAIATATSPPGRARRARSARTRRGRAAAAAVCIGTMMRPKGPPAKSCASATSGASRPSPMCASRSASMSRAVTSWPASASGARDPAGAGADVEDRPGLLVGQPQPQRQVLQVAVALDLVPDDLGARHRQYSAASPRRASSSRSSSRAV